MEKNKEGIKKYQERRLKVYPFSPALLKDLLTQENEISCKIDHGAPAEATLFNFFVNPLTGYICMTLEHPSFDLVPQGQPIPIDFVVATQLPKNPKPSPLEIGR